MNETEEGGGAGMKIGIRKPILVELCLFWAVLLLAGFCRALYLFQYGQTLLGPVAVGPDVQEYMKWARQILGGQWLWTRVHFHAPLYPYLLAFLLRVTGSNLMLVRALQSGLDLAALTATMLAARLAWNRRVALVTGLFWALYLPLIYYSAEFISEGLLVFWLSCAGLSWVTAMRIRTRFGAGSGSTCLYALSGLFVGLASITHPLSLAVGPALAALTVWQERRCRGWRPALAAGVLLLLALLLPVTAVTCRNLAVSGAPVPVQARQGMNFYIGNNPDATGTCNVRPGQEYDALLAWPAEAGHHGAAAATRFYHRRAWAFIRSQPWRWAGLLLRKLALTWNAAEITTGPDLPQLQVLTAFMRLPLLRFGVIAPLALAGFWFSRRRPEGLFFLVLPAVYTITLTIFVTGGRYRLGMIPGLLPAAAAGVDGFWQAFRTENRQAAVTGLGLALAAALPAFVLTPPPVPHAAAEAAELLAEAAWHTERPETALRWLRRGLREKPQDPMMNHLMGVILTDAEEYETALRCLRNAAAANPDNSRIGVDLATLLIRLGHVQQATAELERLRDRYPGDALVWYNLGVLAEGRGEFEAALTCYKRSCRLDPGLVSAHLNAGVLHHRRLEHERAESCYQRVLRLDPDKVQALTGMAILRADQADAGAARRFFEKSLRLDPEQAGLWILYSQFLTACGRRTDAADALRRAVAANPGAEELTAALADLLSEPGPDS